MSHPQIIPHFLTDAEANAQIARLNELGWSDAPVRFASGAASAPRLRNSQRVEFTDTLLARALWERLAGRLTVEELKAIAQMEQGPIALRAWFRGYRYLPGQRFGKHRDAFETDQGQITRVTALIYLSDSADGDDGATILYPELESPPQRVAPRKGSLLLFHSSQLHEGEAPRKGEKIVLRSDLLFER